MRVPLSSPLTFGMKFVFPAVWGGGYATASMFAGKTVARFQGMPAPSAKWVFLALLIVGSLICRRVCLPLKRVVLDDRHLFISNYFREIAVPIEDVNRAGFDRQAVVTNRALVALELKTETVFGQVIEFLPRSDEAVEVLRARLGPVVTRS